MLPGMRIPFWLFVAIGASAACADTPVVSAATDGPVSYLAPDQAPKFPSHPKHYTAPPGFGEHRWGQLRSEFADLPEKPEGFGAAWSPGVVRSVDSSGRVKGRARLALDFTSVTSGGRRYAMSAEHFSRQASATKGEDAAKIGIGAGAGAVIGGLLGGKKGAAEGAAVGGGAGTGLVLATKGEEVRFPSGTDVSIQLSAPLTVRVSR